MRNEVRKDFRFRLFWFLLDNMLLSFYCAATPFLKMRQSSRNSIRRTNIAELPCVAISSCTLRPVWLGTTLWTAAHQLLCAWGHPSKPAGVGCLALLQGVFSTQGSRCFLWITHWQAGSLPLSHRGSPCHNIFNAIYCCTAVPIWFASLLVTNSRYRGMKCLDSGPRESEKVRQISNTIKGC